MYLLSHKYITMKGLSVVKFWDVRPKLPFRFNTTFFTGINAKSDSRLPFCVNNITLPKMEGSASEGSMYLGNTIFTVPVWNIASRKLEITFEETDDMLISQFLGTLMHLTFGRVPYKITVVVTEFEEHMRLGDSSSTAYICHLLSFEEPQFKRDGQAGQVTMSATFIVDAVVENWTENSGVVTGARNVAASNEFNPELDSIYEDYQNEKFTFGNVNFGATADEANGLRQRSQAVLNRQAAVKEAAKANGTSYLAMSMANGSDKKKSSDTTLTDDEIKHAQEIQKQLDSTATGKALQTFAEELSTKSYGWGMKGKDGDISKTDGIDCSGAVGAWVEQQGYSVDECTAGASNGGLAKQLEDQGVKQKNLNQMKVGDIVTTTSHGGGVGHTMIFAGYDSNGNAYFVDSSGSAGGGTVSYTQAELEKNGYKAYNTSERKK